MQTNEKKWKLIEILNATTGYLKQKNIENPRLNAEMLLSHVLNLTRVDLYINFERLLSPQEVASYKTLLKRRLNHEPLQYILGEVEFMSLKFKVDKNVLIPRPETEVLVEKVMDLHKATFKDASIRILDIGTGSGNIAISLAKYILPATIVAVDVCELTLKVAGENAERHDVVNQIQFKLADVLSDDFPDNFSEPFDVVISNPPYISTGECNELPEEIKKFEPMIALDGKNDGIYFYTPIARMGHRLLKNGGFIALETGVKQRTEIEQILETQGFAEIKCFHDLNGLDRVLVGRKP